MPTPESHVAHRLATALTAFPAVAHAEEDADAGPTIVVNGAHIERIEAVDSLAHVFGGKGGYWEDNVDYEWYAGV